jgi:hypothetical protein
MKKQIALLVFLIYLVFVNCLNGQISITGYSHGVVGISTSQDRLIGSELKFFSDKTVGNGKGLVEIDGFINFKKQTYHQLSIGLGLNSQLINGVFLNALEAPLNLRIYPFVDNKNFLFLNRLSLILELSPEYYPYYDYFGDCWHFRTLIGVRFNLSE